MEYQLLTRDDFSGTFQRNFNCPLCGEETTNITRQSGRHGKRKFLATFQCSNLLCKKRRWYKCRVCHDDKVLIRNVARHVKSKKHEQFVTAFEASKDTAYLEKEEAFIVGTSYRGSASADKG